MAFRRDEDDDLDIPQEEEDVMADTVIDNHEDDEEGEDLFGENMAADYEVRPELDHYDPDMLDEAEHEPLTVEQRLAAEQAMDERDALAAGRRRPRQDPGTPGFPAATSDLGDVSGPEASTPGSDRRRGAKRRRVAADSADRGDDEEDEDDEDIPEAHYDLTHERLDECLAKGEGIDKRLELKIRRCFKMFLAKYRVDETSEPRYADMLRKMGEENELHLDVSFKHIQDWSPALAIWIADYPNHILPLLNQTLLEEVGRRFGTYRTLIERDETELRVGVHSFQVRELIRELRTYHLNRLVSVQGVVTKRLRVNNEVKRLYLRCAKCNFLSPPYDVQSEKDFRPGTCIECQSRGPWRVDRSQTVYRNHQRLTIQEAPGTVAPGKMPRSKEVVVTGDLVDTVRPGDELQLTGIYRALYDSGTNARTCFPVFRTEIQAVHMHRRGDVKLIEITEERQAQIFQLAKDPNVREKLIASIAPSIYGMKHVKTAIALSMMGGQKKVAAGKHRIRGDINTLIVGDPGLAKSQFLKYIEQTFPRAVYTTGKGASAVGLTAAVTRDENGDWGLEGGAMVMADDGMCLIDEFDKMNDNDRTSLHEAMEQQTISVSKAGIVATLKAQCSVVAVANPIEGRYDPQRTFSQNVNLTDPILSRFDILCVLRDESDPVQDERLADHVVCSHIRSHPEADGQERAVRPKLAQQGKTVEPIDQDLLKYYIIYARKNVHPKVTDVDKEKIARFYSELRSEAFRSGGQAMTARHVDSLMRLAEANARLELRNHVTSKDIDHAIQMTLESFIQSQKHQVASELRKKFDRFLPKVETPTDQFYALLDQLFKAKFDQIRQARGGVAPELAEVGIDMADVARQLEQDDAENLTFEAAQSVMRSANFKVCFRVVGEQIFRTI